MEKSYIGVMMHNVITFLDPRLKYRFYQSQSDIESLVTKITTEILRTLPQISDDIVIEALQKSLDGVREKQIKCDDQKLIDLLSITAAILAAIIAAVDECESSET